MYNYVIGYNLFKNKELVASGDAFVESSCKILRKSDYEDMKKKLEESCKKNSTKFTYVQIVSLNYLGKVE